MEILQNQVLQFVIVTIISALTIIVPLIIYRKKQQKKKISYRILSNTSLLMVEEGIKEDIEIFYKSKPVKQVQLLILRI